MSTPKPYTTEPVPDRPGWHRVYDLAGHLHAYAERRTSWWCLYWASDDEPTAHGRPYRYETLDEGARAYLPTDAPAPLAWDQVEPRRYYRATTGGRTYNLIRKGRAALGHGLDTGWYIEGGLDGKGSEFMGKRLQEAADTATRRIRDAEKHEHVWVTALDGNDQPALDADGKTWTHCGVCGTLRDQQEATR